MNDPFAEELNDTQNQINVKMLEREEKELNCEQNVETEQVDEGVN